MGPVLRADEVGRKRLTLRSMEARRPRKSGALAKKFVAFRFCANALLAWASFTFPDRVGISTNKTEKVDRFYGNPFAHNWEDSLCARCYSLPVLASWLFRASPRARMRTWTSGPRIPSNG